jgi:hypothetical protein
LASTNNEGGQDDDNDGYGSSSFCDPVTTHFVNSDSTWVPRVLMIDESTVTVPATTNEIPDGGASSSASFLLQSSYVPWHGNIQVLGDQTSNKYASPFVQTASTSAYSPYSRYHYTAATASSTQQSAFRISTDNPRHVEWDDDEKEEQHVQRHQQQGANDYAQVKYRRAQQEWKATTSLELGQELQQQAPTHFASCRSSPHWTDIWMPPYSLQASNVVLPFSSQTQLVPHWNVAYSTNNDNNSNLPFLQEWKENVLLEHLRRLLEPCDCGIQGAMITTEGIGRYASLTTWLLEQLQEECKSATRWVNHVQSITSAAAPAAAATAATGADENLNDWSSWQERRVAQVRENISQGLVLYDFSQNAHVVLPLRVDCRSDSTFLERTAQIAIALEACGLPFRLRGLSHDRRVSTPYQMGLQNAPFLAQGGSDTAWGTTTSCISMNEYLTMLRPMPQYSRLEMDVLMLGSTMDNQSMYNAIRLGTSVERDQRMRRLGEDGHQSRPQDVPPGAWLGDANSRDKNQRGLLSSLSYCTDGNRAMTLDRSSHHHFALSTMIRPMLIAPTRDNEGVMINNYLTCLIQGMGIPHRPERSMAVVVDETLGNLTFGSEGGGSSYGAGIYWKTLLPTVDTPIVAVLGNTTRAFGALNDIASTMKTTLRERRFHGYIHRDVKNGVLPETDDCDEALEGCLDKRDLYQPPEWKWLESDDDGF